MATRIKAQAALDAAGVTIEDCVIGDSDTPACCSEGCMVEPDGKCEHGYPSALRALGIL